MGRVTAGWPPKQSEKGPGRGHRGQRSKKEGAGPWGGEEWQGGRGLSQVGGDGWKGRAAGGTWGSDG